MNDQEIFDTVVTHLFAQGKQSVNGSMCMYRGIDGTSCAVGCLIPDDMYHHDMEDKPTEILIADQEEGLYKVPDWFSYKLRLLVCLQHVHDTARNWSSTLEMKSVLMLRAKEFNLDPSILADKSFSNR